MRRLFQVTLLLVSLPPLVFGILGVINGAAAYVPAEVVTADLDSLIRFSGVWYSFAFFFAVWVVRNMEIAGPVMTIGFVLMALGGAARVFSGFVVGVPGTGAIIAATVQISLLAFIPWHRAIMTNTTAALPSP